MLSAPTSSLKASPSAAALLTAVIVFATGCATPYATRTPPAQSPTAKAGTNSHNFDNVESFSRMSGADWQASLTPLFNRAKNAVQLETDTDLSHVTFAVVPNELIEKEVAAETGRLTHSQFTDNQFADHFLTTVMAGQSGTYAALYSTETQQVMVSSSLLSSYISSVGDNAQAIKHALNALLIHELVHAADDTRYGIHRNRNLNFRASFAQSAVYEGHAQYVTRQICQKGDCSTGLRSLDKFMFGDELAPNQLPQPVQAVSRNVLEYSYVEGERFIASLAQRSNGQSLIHDALKTPPVDPIQILDPSSFPNTTRKELNQHLLEASKSINHPWTTKPWVRVETSPLKGVNLRSDPTRRTSAIDGFTRLIRGMVALQHYNQSALDASPVEITLMNAETAKTAEMFAQSLSSNLIYNSGGVASEEVVWLDETVPVSVINVTTQLDDGQSHVAMVVSHQRFVMQLVGIDIENATALAYAKSVLSNLTGITTSGSAISQAY